ncbi:glycerophosphodiester phosphodiesterase [Rhodococcus erythropolis]|uniref:glycerophosphodiester phosphodiesterase n=1 Tax=Rhodococcus erythropolis TaxID=1833 RepID=UPI00366E61D0
MAVALVGTPTTASVNGTTLTLPCPADVHDGDLLVAVLRNQLSSSTTDFGVPAGWVRRGPAFVGTQSAGRISGFFTLAVPSAAALPATFAFTAASARTVGAILVVRGADLDNPISGSSGSYGGTILTSGARVEPFAVAADNCLQLVFGGNEVVSPNESTATVTAGFTSVVHVQSSTGTAATRTVIDVYQRAAGTPNSVAAEITWLSVSGAGAQGIAIRPGVFTAPAPQSLAVVAKTANGTESGKLWAFNGTDLVPITKALWLPQPSCTIAQMLTSHPFYWAHRGGSANWLELSPQAYTNAVWHGASCLEVSVHRTADGVFVMSHDPSTLRMTGVDKVIKTSTWAQLSGLTATSNGQSGPLYRLDDYLDLPYARTHVTVIEDKSYANMTAMLDLVESRIPDALDRVIVKAYAGGGTSHMSEPNARGYQSWGYYYTADMAKVATTHGVYTMLGLSYDAPQADWDTMTGLGKPVVGHIVSSPAEAASALAKGAAGLQVANVLTVIPKVNDLP